MKNAKPTPGPWKVKYKKNDAWTIYGADGYNVAAIPEDDDYGRTPEDAANARLIASVPDLLDAIDDLVSELEQNGCVEYMNEASDFSGVFNRRLKAARSAIAKARGIK